MWDAHAPQPVPSRHQPVPQRPGMERRLPETPAVRRVGRRPAGCAPGLCLALCPALQPTPAAPCAAHTAMKRSQTRPRMAAATPHHWSHPFAPRCPRRGRSRCLSVCLCPPVFARRRTPEAAHPGGGAPRRRRTPEAAHPGGGECAVCLCVCRAAHLAHEVAVHRGHHLARVLVGHVGLRGSKWSSGRVRCVREHMGRGHVRGVCAWV